MKIREQQRALARQAILDACADLVTERRHLNFSMQDVATGAGVSLRTVYNHFAAREDLLDALGEVFNERMTRLGGASVDDLESVDDLVQAVHNNFSAFEQLGGVSDAFAQMPLPDAGRDLHRRERTQVIAGFIAGLMPHAPDPEPDNIGLVLRHLLSHRSWFWLTREYGLSSQAAADVVAWVVTTAVDAAEAGNGPTRRGDKE